MPTRLPRPVLAAAAGALLLVLVAVAAAYAYFFSNLRSTPSALALPSPSASASAAQAAQATPAGLAGSWIATGASVAGYRVREQFAGQTSPHEAVARTSGVSGGATVTTAGAALQVSGLQLTAQLAGLKSQDTVAGFDVVQRDRIVSQTLGVGQFPTATFAADPFTVPAGLDSGRPATLSVPGRLTVHGVTQPVTVAVQLQLAGDQVQAAGQAVFDMTQFGIRKPTQPFVTPDSTVTLEFQLVLSRAP